MIFDVLFLAPYPTKDNIKDGMVSRINAIDSFFKERRRAYIEVRYLKNFKKESFVDGQASIYKLNFFTHLFLIINLFLKSKMIYSHSIWGCWGVWFLLPFYRGQFVLDAHGVVPEEVSLYTKNKVLSFFLRSLELIVFKRVNVVICVTNAMKVHFQHKYPFFKREYMVYSIYPDSIRRIDFNKTIPSKENSCINIIYSGGVSAWQNIDMMLETIKRIQSDIIKYTLLVSDKQYILDKLKEKEMSDLNIDVESVHPDELFSYYSKADYAFILRDNNVVNNVANPTKLVEYLSYGIIPIVLTARIGDYESLGYEYLSITDLGDLSKPLYPSRINIEIAKKLLEINREVNISYDILMKSIH